MYCPICGETMDAPDHCEICGDVAGMSHVTTSRCRYCRDCGSLVSRRTLVCEVCFERLAKETVYPLADDMLRASK